MQNGKYMSELDTRRLKSYMVAAGYTITSLAKEVGMGREVLSTRVNGKTDFSRNEMMKIADVLNERPETIFFGIKVT